MIELNSGYEMPTLGLGTWTLTGQVCEEAVYAALKSGYRLIDTAKYYGNESEVGKAVTRAISDGICKREEIFITTKLVPWSSNPNRDIEDSLQKLGLSYIDLCLLHQHGSVSGDDAVYSAMIRGVKEGKIRSIGISNFYTEKSVSHFINDFEIPPAVIQNENHLKYQNKTLQDWAAKKGIFIERLPFRRSRPHGRASEERDRARNRPRPLKDRRAGHRPLALAVALPRCSGEQQPRPHRRELRRVGFCSHRKRDEAARLFAGNPAASDYE